MTGKGSTYHGDEGVVVGFCKNGSHKSVYVDLNNQWRRLSTQNLSLRRDVKYNSTSKASQPNTSGSQTDDMSVAGSLSHSVMSSRSEAYAHKVLTLYEYVENPRLVEEHNEQDLDYKLQ